LLTVVGLSERNNVRALWRGAAKHHHHQASFNPVVPTDSRLWVSLARVFSHHHFRIKHDPRSQKGQTKLAYVGVVFDDVAREFHLEKYMHYCMHKSMEPLYRCTKVDELQLTPLDGLCLPKAQGIKVKKGLFPWTASGRAIANGRDEGVTKLLFDDSPEAHGHGKILGGGMVGTHAGDMIGEVALAIEMGADAIDIGKTIHPHPTLGESIGMAAEVAHGSCTDLPPARK
jgi:hypothetical protein